MNALQLLITESKRLGLRQGESAKSFQTRNPKAALQLAELIRTHKAELVKSVSAAVSADDLVKVRIKSGQIFKGVRYFEPALFDCSANYAAHLVDTEVAEYA